MAELLFGEELNFLFAEFVELFRANRSGCEEVSEAGVEPLESRAGFEASCVKCDVVFFFVHISHNGDQYIRIFLKVNSLFQLFLFFLEAVDLILLTLVADCSEVMLIAPLRYADEAFPITLGSVLSATLLADQLFVFF